MGPLVLATSSAQQASNLETPKQKKKVTLDALLSAKHKPEVMPIKYHEIYISNNISTMFCALLGHRVTSIIDKRFSGSTRVSMSNDYQSATNSPIQHLQIEKCIQGGCTGAFRGAVFIRLPLCMSVYLLLRHYSRMWR
jgi:hypothetical protein